MVWTTGRLKSGFTGSWRRLMAESFDSFVEIIAALRGPDGCPWDKKQTHASLKRYFVEETYEALQAIDDGDDEELAAELGDVLLQIGLHAQIASERGGFSIDDVVKAINAKLIRRHPHVFGDTRVDGVDQVLANWETIKSQERGAEKPESALDGVPQAFPGLLLALEVSKKAARQGFEWPDMAGVLTKMREEVDELEEELAREAHRRERIEDEIGDLLFTVVNVARWAEVDPEEALRRMVRRFARRFQAMEREAKQAGQSLKALTPEEWEAYWQASKRTEHPGLADEGENQSPVR